MEDFDIMLFDNTTLTRSTETVSGDRAQKHCPKYVVKDPKEGVRNISTCVTQHDRQKSTELPNAEISIRPENDELLDIIMEVIDSKPAEKTYDEVCLVESTGNNRSLEGLDVKQYTPFATTGGGVQLKPDFLMSSKDIIDEAYVVDLKKKTDVQMNGQVVIELAKSKRKAQFDTDNYRQTFLPPLSHVSSVDTVCVKQNNTNYDDCSISLDKSLNVSVREMKDSDCSNDLNTQSNNLNGQTKTLVDHSHVLVCQGNTFSVQNSIASGQRITCKSQSKIADAFPYFFDDQGNAADYSSNGCFGNRKTGNVQCHASDGQINGFHTNTISLDTGVKVSQAEFCTSVDKVDSQATVISKFQTLNLSDLLAAIKDGSLKDVYLFPRKETYSDAPMKSLNKTNVYPMKLAEPSGLGYPVNESSGIYQNVHNQNNEASFLHKQYSKTLQESDKIQESVEPLEMYANTDSNNDNSLFAENIHKPVRDNALAMHNFENTELYDTFSIHTTRQCQAAVDNATSLTLSSAKDNVFLEKRNTHCFENPMMTVSENSGVYTHDMIKRILRDNIIQKRSTSQVCKQSRYHPYCKGCQTVQQPLPNLPEFNN